MFANLRMARTPSTPKRATAPRKLRTPVAAAALRRRRQFLAANFSNEMLIEMGKTLNAFLQGFFPGDADFQVDIPAPQDAAAVKQLVDDMVGVDARIEPERSPLTLSRLADRADMEREARVRGVFFGRNDTDDALLELLMQAQVISDEETGTTAMQEKVRDLEQQIRHMQQQQSQFQVPAEFTEVVGGLKRVIQQQLQPDTEAKSAKKKVGVLGLHDRWKQSGDSRFQRWVESHMKQQRAKADGGGKWVARLQTAQETEHKAQEALFDYQDEYDDAEEERDKVRTRVQLDEAFKLWIEALEELRVVYKCHKEKDPRRADHIHDVYRERRYGTKEDRAMEDLEKEADVRSKRDRTVETDHLLQDYRLKQAKTSVFERMGGHAGEQRRGHESPSMQEAPSRSQARLAEDVFAPCQEEIRGMYVTANAAFMYEEPKLEWAAQVGHKRGEHIPWNKYPKPVCFFCKGDDHSTWECEVAEYTDREGRRCVPPLRLHKMGNICGRGRVYDHLLKRE